MRSALALVFDEQVREMLIHFEACFQVRIGFIAADGRELVTGRQEPLARWCQLVRSCSGERSCQDCDQRHREEALRRDRLLVYRCHSGLIEAVMPMRVGEVVLGYVMIGQFREDDRVPPAYRATWQRAGRDPAELDAAHDELTCLPPQRQRHMLALFELLVKHLRDSNLVSLRGSAEVESVLAHVRAQPERPMPLDRAAALLGRSQSQVARLFRRHCGCSFTQALLETRLTLAEDWLSAHPDGRIAEAAEQAGFSDAAQFSRMFSKHRGYAPSRLRKEGECKGRKSGKVEKGEE